MQTQSIVLGGGCFWCLHSAYNLVRGVTEVLEGYAGGTSSNPTYAQVSSGRTGHAEVVKVTFNPEEISLTDILDIFWTIHDPTQLNRQGGDVGTQYRSAIFYTAEQESEVRSSLQLANKVWDGKIVTELKALDKFYPAEPDQYEYAKKRPDYCNLVINPKLDKLRQKFSTLIKT